MENCIFCKIVRGEIPSYKVYETEDTLAFLDIKPFSKGHCLVIPKQHSENIFDIGDEDLKNVIVACKHIAEILKEKLNADGIRFSQSNGKVAGQEVMHFHLHVIPRYLNDNLPKEVTLTARPSPEDTEELKKLAEKIYPVK